MSNALRIDLVFSYWIYLWYVLYVFKITMFSPKFAIAVGLLDNLVMLVLMILFGTSIKTLLFFLIINTIIKVLPFYYLRNEMIYLKDVYFTFGLFVVFIIWLHLNKESLIGNMKLIYYSLLYGKNQTPFMNFLTKVERNFKSLNII